MSEVGVKLTGDNTEFIAMMSNSASQAAKYSSEIANKVGDKLYGLRDVSHAVATALGLSLENISEHVARWATGMSKAEEEAFKSMESVSDQLAATTIKNIRSQMSEEDKYRANLADREKLLNQINATVVTNGQTALKVKKLELEAAQKDTEILEYQKKTREEIAKKAEEFQKNLIGLREKEYAASTASLSADNKIASLKEVIIGLQTTLNSGVLSQQNAEQLTVQLGQRKVELLAEEGKLAKENAEKTAKALKEHIDLLKEKSRLTFDALSDEEKIKTLQTSIITITKLIAAYKKEGKDTTELEVGLMENQKDLAGLRGKKEEETKTTLDVQLKALKDQGMSREQMIEVLKAQGFGEDEILAKLEKQTAEIERQISIKRSGANYEDQSTAGLEGVRDRLKSQLDKVRIENAMAPPSQRNPFEVSLQSEFDQVTRELNARQNVGDYATRFGEDATRRQYGDTLTERAVRDLRQDTTQTAIAVTKLQQQLQDFFKFKPVP